jgi:hypothetical protein
MKALALAAAIICFAACTMTPDTGIPEGYVSVPTRGDEVLSAVAPTGNRMVVKRHTNPPEGTLEFWRDAVRNELVDGRGYEVVESQGVAGAKGAPAWEMLFKVTRQEGAYLYLVTIRVDGSSVIVAEAGGQEASIQPDLDTLRQAMR